MTKRPSKSGDGMYHIKGHKYSMVRGSRSRVWHGTAFQTPGGLKKQDLMMNKSGHIVSRKKHNTAKRENRLVKYGFLTKKGHFGFIRKDGKKSRRHTRKRRGGSGGMAPLGFADANGSNQMGGRRRRSRKHRGGYRGLSPAEVGSSGIDGGNSFHQYSNNDLQSAAGMAGGRRRRHRRGGAGAVLAPPVKPMPPAPPKMTPPPAPSVPAAKH